MTGNIDMGDNKVTNLATPTNNDDAATKKYVDDKKSKFKDGSTTTSDIDLRKSGSTSEFYDDVEFKAKSKCKDLNVLSTSNEIVNKNTLETGGLVGIQSLNFVVRGLFTQMAKTELGVHFAGEFRLFGDHLTNFGRAYSINSDGVYNEIEKQRLEKISSEPKLLGLNMTWVFENEVNAAVNMTTDSYFYLERINTI